MTSHYNTTCVELLLNDPVLVVLVYSRFLPNGELKVNEQLTLA